MLLYLQATVNRSGQATVGNRSTRAYHWNRTLQVTGKHPCSGKVKQHCGTFILQCFWLIFTFITQLIFNSLVVEWLNKQIKKCVSLRIAAKKMFDKRYRYDLYLSQVLNIIAFSALAWRYDQNWIIPYLYRLFLVCPETWISYSVFQDFKELQWWISL